jgi:hypothetical protein
VERGELSSERDVLLTALVAEHVKVHHDDPQQSLVEKATGEIASNGSTAACVFAPEEHASWEQDRGR